MSAENEPLPIWPVMLRALADSGHDPADSTAAMARRLIWCEDEIARLRAALAEIAQETGTPYGRIAQAALDGGTT